MKLWATIAVLLVPKKTTRKGRIIWKAILVQILCLLDITQKCITTLDHPKADSPLYNFQVKTKNCLQKCVLKLKTYWLALVVNDISEVGSPEIIDEATILYKSQITNHKTHRLISSERKTFIKSMGSRVWFGMHNFVAVSVWEVGDRGTPHSWNWGMRGVGFVYRL